MELSTKENVTKYVSVTISVGVEYAVTFSFSLLSTINNLHLIKENTIYATVVPQVALCSTE